MLRNKIKKTIKPRKSNSSDNSAPIKPHSSINAEDRLLLLVGLSQAALPAIKRLTAVVLSFRARTDDDPSAVTAADIVVAIRRCRTQLRELVTGCDFALDSIAPQLFVEEPEDPQLELDPEAEEGVDEQENDPGEEEEYEPDVSPRIFRGEDEESEAR